ncbi:MAG: PorT family protein [Bacteroidetes bacterium]|nr:PorT family protein [Bacteroidota bacterium]HET6244504.1 porin family protein [Bacteroidia bacterium]
MKKTIFILVSIFLFFLNVKAQDLVNPNTISIGPRVGINMSGLSMEDQNTSSRIAPTFGVMMVYSWNRSFGIAADLMYVPMGAKIEIPSNGSSRELNISLNYLHLPIQGLYFYDLTESFRPKIGLGPYVSFLVNSSEKIDGMEVNTGRAYAPLDFGVNATIGFNYLITPRIWLNTDLRYALGLINIEAANGPNTTNTSLGLTIGVGFSLGTIVN